MMRSVELDHWITLGVGLALGIALGAITAALVALGRRHRIAADLTSARSRCELLEQQALTLQRETEAVRKVRDEAEARRESAQREAAILQETLRAEQANVAAQRQLLDDARLKLRDAFLATGGEALASNARQFIELAKATLETVMTEARGAVDKKHQAIDAMVNPIRELLEKHHTAVGALEAKREGAYRGLEQQIQTMAVSQEKLGTETSRLVRALRRSEHRGRWGELQLRNAVELAGMSQHCDFDLQVTIWNGEAAQRPDMVVRMPQKRLIPVDAKVAIDAYLDLQECENEQARGECVRRHAEQVEKHYRSLANKRYWEGFSAEHAPQMVVMFMPLESALVTALECKPDLLSDAMSQHVFIATPTLLIAMLRIVAHGWQQQALAENAREIGEVGRELYDRLSTFCARFEEVRSSIERVNRSYNAAAGSFERMLLPSARKLKSLHATTDAELETPGLIETEPRPVVAAELRAIAETHAASRGE
jgi:DNA recombination protein RmuC